MPKPVKVETVQMVREKIEAASSIVVTDYRGLSVAQMTDLRARLRKEGVEYKIVKNRLTKIALKEAGLDTMDAHLKGMTAIAFGMKDSIAPAKVLTGYAKDNEKLKIIAGLMDKQVLNAASIVELSKLPSREALLATFLGDIKSPVQNFASVLNQTMCKIAYALDALIRKKEEQGA